MRLPVNEQTIEKTGWSEFLLHDRASIKSDHEVAKVWIFWMLFGCIWLKSLFRHHLWGMEMGFFLFRQLFGRSIYSSLRNVSGIIKKLVPSRIRNWKDFLNFDFFEVSSYRGLKFHVNAGYLVHFYSFLA